MKIAKFLLAAALMVSGMAANAQETERVEFNPHWFLGLQGGAQYTLGEADFSKLISPNAQLSVGYQFTPVWAVRLAANAWQSKGGFKDNSTYKWNYVAPGVDVKFNIINAIAGYNPNRVFSMNLIAGAAANIAWGNDEAQKVTDYQMNKLWDGTSVLPVGRAGLDFDFRLSKRVSLNLEAMANGTFEKYNSKAPSKDTHNADWYFNALLGLKIALGKTENVIPVAVPVVVEEPAPAPVVKPTPKPTPKPVVKKAEMQTEIFYAIRETVITDGEKYKVENLISFLKANPETKVAVTGYADVETGNPRINMFYSQGRAAGVAKALTDAGIDAERITVDAKGDTVQPFSENDKNRVSICIAK